MISSETYKKEESNQLSDNSSKNSNLKTLLTFCIKTKYLENNLLIDEYFEKDLEIIQNKSKKLNFGYVPGVIKHHFHGNKKNRKYYLRNEILKKYNYSPTLHITKDSKGLIIPTEYFPEQLKDDIYNYFLERNDDEFL